jgi:hypothetical protein
MATLGTQNISTSYSQVLKTFGSDIVGPTLAAVASGNEAGVSALQISTTGVKSTGTFAVDGASTLLGPVTFGSHITASTGTATIATASISTATISTATISTATISTATISTATISTATISTATIPLQLGPVTFGTNVTMSTGTATIGTLFASGPATFGTNFTASTGTATIGTIASTTINNTGLATVGTLEIGGTAGPNITKVSYATASFGSAVVAAHNVADTTNGTFLLTGVELGDIVIGSINSLGSTTGTTQVVTSFFPVASNIVRYVVNSKGATAGTVPAGTIFATAMRFTT